MTDALIATLRHVELFHGMTENHLRKIADIAQPLIYAAGDVVFRQGDVGDALYLISTGQVEVQVYSNGEANAAVYLGKGQTIGEMSLVDQTTRSATIIAVDDQTTLYRITIPDFMALCASETGIGFVLMRNIAQDLSFKLRHSDTNVNNQDEQGGHNHDL
jgi:CRP/FNR family cyclic AMP-dependent transcriptional regulator